MIGDPYKDPRVLEPGWADAHLLAPLYAKLHTAIRAVDTQHVIFFEPCVADIMASGLAEGPGGPAFNDRQVYSYHIYCGTGEPTNMFLCNETDSLFVKAKMEDDLARLGTAGFMTYV